MLRKNWDALVPMRQRTGHARSTCHFASRHVHHGSAQLLLGAGVAAATSCRLRRGHAPIRATWSEFCFGRSPAAADGYVPLTISSAPPAAREAVEMGAKALLIPSRCPDGHSPSRHISPSIRCGRSPRRPACRSCFHVGGGGPPWRMPISRTAAAGAGLPWRRRQFPLDRLHGHRLSADEGADGVDRRPRARPLPRLKFGVIEQGASWCRADAQHGQRTTPSTRTRSGCRNVAQAPASSCAPSGARTPHPHEDTGWIIANSGDEVCLFSSDYPHVGGRRNPIKRFEASMEAAGIDESAEAALLLRQLRRPYGCRAVLPREIRMIYTTLLTERVPAQCPTITTNRLEVLNAQSRGPARGARRRLPARRRRRGGARSSWPAPAALRRARSRQPAGNGGPEEDAAGAWLQGRVRRLWERFFEEPALSWRDLPKPTIAQGPPHHGRHDDRLGLRHHHRQRRRPSSPTAPSNGRLARPVSSMPWDFGPRKTKGVSSPAIFMAPPRRSVPVWSTAWC